MTADGYVRKAGLTDFLIGYGVAVREARIKGGIMWAIITHHAFAEARTQEIDLDFELVCTACAESRGRCYCPSYGRLIYDWAIHRRVWDYIPERNGRGDHWRVSVVSIKRETSKMEMSLPELWNPEFQKFLDAWMGEV